ncbi:hypothetical protein QRD43_06675 [Pelomonas sp. APW6]|uniref:Exonuclease domain-containing protein n=1 Tax=Roseateles subflavus TaxID=3053353 RepID=A0ABT7LFG5_9BURK|nr:hypothetical protein [Pelomonas sp. APW6]MDL5031589.1 hypothetical protein [Pelomonas sp. APW6]
MQLPTMLDVEASGFGRGSYPIEIGFVAADGGLFCTLVQPAPGWEHWDPAAESLHGISRELLQRHGRPVDWVAAELNRRLAGQTVYCDGWGHDYPWIARLFDEAERSPAFRLEDVRVLLDERQLGGWDRSLRALRDELRPERHRASSDARLLQLCVQRVRTAAHAG